MKQGQTYHEFGCTCGHCKMGNTRHPDHRMRNDDGDLLSQKRQEIADVLDGPDQECYLLEATGPWYPRPEPDDPTKPDVEYVTNPTHGGKVTCYKCNGFIPEEDGVGYWSFQHRNEFPHVHFHKDCYNHYEHYYGLDKPID